MAVYCAQANLAFSSATRRDQVLADIQSRIAGHARWSADVLEPAVLHHGQFGIRLETRFTARAGADDLLSRVQAFATGPRSPLPGSWIRLHDCTHDEGTNACVVTAERVW